jgi:ATP-dependent exoDNAse (exonuclease V) beta subunit
MSALNNVLALSNPHERDKHIRFTEEGHKYTILTDPDSKYTSVTTWNHSHFPHFDADAIIKSMMKGKGWKVGHKYWGLTADQIKKQWADSGASASGAGTALHFDIECFMNNQLIPYPYTHKQLRVDTPSTNDSLEWKYFLEFIKDMPHLKPYRTEWTVYNEDLKLAGSIDMVYENPDGTLSIYDWKRAKDITRINVYNKFALTYSISHMPDSNFWHYALQLNTYKAIIESKYDKRVTDLFLVRLHPEAIEKTYELIKLPILTNEIKVLFDDIHNNESA